jgi:putative lipoic acid-binding regulatory protein
MTDSSASAIEFPCRFPVKAMGLNEGDFVDHVLALVAEHVDHVEAEQLRSQTSRSGRYVSVTLTIEARSRAQLDAIYASLSGDPRVLVSL